MSLEDNYDRNRHFNSYLTSRKKFNKKPRRKRLSLSAKIRTLPNITDNDFTAERVQATLKVFKKYARRGKIIHPDLFIWMLKSVGHFSDLAFNKNGNTVSLIRRKTTSDAVVVCFEFSADLIPKQYASNFLTVLNSSENQTKIFQFGTV